MTIFVKYALGNTYNKLVLSGERASQNMRQQNITQQQLAADTDNLRAKIETMKTSYSSMLHMDLGNGNSLEQMLNRISLGLDNVGNRSFLKVLKTEFDTVTESARKLDAMILKQQPSKAVEKLPQQLQAASHSLEYLNAGFRNLDMIPQSEIDSITKLKMELDKINNRKNADYIPDAEGQLKSLRQINLQIEGLNQQLDIYKEKQRGIRAETRAIENLQKQQTSLSAGVSKKLSYFGSITKGEAYSSLVPQNTKTEIQTIISEYQRLQSLLGQKQSLTSLKSLEEELKGLDRRYDEVIGSVKSFQSALTSDDRFHRYQKQLQASRLELEKFYQSNQKLQRSGSFFNRYNELVSKDVPYEKLAEYNKEIAIFKKEAAIAGKIGKTAMQTLKESVGAFTGWLSIAGVVASTWRKFREGVTTLKEVDTYLTEISKTSERSTESL